MLRFLKFLPLIFCGLMYAQEEVVQSVYFEFGKFNLDEKQATAAIDFIKKTDTTRIESVQIFGYTDDVGKQAYNFKLSTNRADAIKNCLIQSGIKNKIIVTIEGNPNAGTRYENGFLILRSIMYFLSGETEMLV